MAELQPSSALAVALRRQLGEDAVVTAPARLQPYMEERRGLYPGRGRLVVRPASTEALASAVRLCAEHNTPMVAQAGNTGTVGGGSPRNAGEVVISVERLNRVRRVDPQDATLTAEAGCTLASVQHAAASVGRLFPLSLPSEAQCCIGGNLATNAGGLNVLRYGNMRDLTLGLEVVLADGRIWSNLKGLRKDNSSYDLRNLMIGSEGTLGVITAATLRLFPALRSRRVALLALGALEPALDLVRSAQAESGDAVVAAELMSAEALAMGRLLGDVPDAPLPDARWLLLIELATPDPRANLDDALCAVLEPALQDGRLLDALIAPSEASAERLWRLRTAIPDGQKHAGASIKHDIAVSPGDLAAFLPNALAAVADAEPGVRPCVFGHIGDGNLHFNLSQPEGGDPAAFLRRRAVLNRVVHDEVIRFGGSIAAEHGVGQLRVDEMRRCGDPVRAGLMRRIKEALDPAGRLNPGKKIV